MKRLALLLVLAAAGFSACSTTNPGSVTTVRPITSPHDSASAVRITSAVPVPVQTNTPPPPQTNAPPQTNSPPQPKVLPQIDREAERRILLDTDIDFSRVSVEKGAAEAFFEFLAPDAISLPVGEFPIRGRDAIKIHLAAGPQGTLAWTPVEAEVARSGDLGYTWGNYEFRSEGTDGKRQITYGKYISIWKKQTDGAWKVVLDGGNPSPPPTQRR